MSCLQACLISFPFLAIVERGGVKGLLGEARCSLTSVPLRRRKLNYKHKK